MGSDERSDGWMGRWMNVGGCGPRRQVHSRNQTLHRTMDGWVRRWEGEEMGGGNGRMMSRAIHMGWVFAMKARLEWVEGVATGGQ